MQKYIIIFCFLSLASTMLQAQFSGKGTGTANDPYRITNADELFEVRNDLEAYYKLMNDVDLKQWIEEDNPVQGWSPIGNEATPFKGNFDGNNNLIKGLYINRPSINNVGFWGCVSSANIQNVGFINPCVIGKENTGIVIGKYGFDPEIFSKQYVENIIVINGKLTGSKNTGSIIGKIEPTTYQFRQYNDKENTVLITGCFSSSVINASDSNCGGICGSICSGSYSYYSSAGSSFRYYQTYKVAVEDNVFNGLINSISGTVGGIVGYAEGWSINYHSGVYAVSEGLSLSYVVERNCLLGIIRGSTGFVCGIFGDSGNKTENCSLLNNVSAADTIFAKKDASIYRISNMECPNNYASSNTIIDLNGKQITIEDNNCNGISYGLKTLKKQTTYEGIGFDFSTRWTIMEGETFPYNKKQSTPPVVTSFTAGSKGTISGTATGSGTIYVLVGNDVYESYILDNKWSVTLGSILKGTAVKVVASLTGLLPSISIVSIATEGEIEMPDVIKGDANGDGVVDAADVVAIVNYILGKASSSFVKANSDINGDGNILVDDAVATVQLVLDK